MDQTIAGFVRKYYWEQDINCARTCLITLGSLFHYELNPQTIRAAIGLHGAGGYRAQCGLVEGTLMFIGCYFSDRGRTDAEIADLCYRFAEAFEKEFGSLRCYDLRPNGFTAEDKPHL
jgi:C_GCAxxG_C_C family probable redox protein